MNGKALIFDLDGTLVDTLPDLHAALASMLCERDLAPPSAEVVRTMIGDGARALVERALTWCNTAPDADEFAQAYSRFLDIYGAKPASASRVFAGVAATLDELANQGFRLAVCTNKPQAPSMTILETLGLAKYFSAVVGGDTGLRRKPDPDHLRVVLQELGVPHDAAIMIGDSSNDLAAAHGIDMKCILVDFGYCATPVATLGADAVISTFEELPEHIHKLLIN